MPKKKTDRKFRFMVTKAGPNGILRHEGETKELEIPEDLPELDQDEYFRWKDIEIATSRGDPDPYHKMCKICGKWFEAKDPRREVCSIECKRERKKRYNQEYYRECVKTEKP